MVDLNCTAIADSVPRMDLATLNGTYTALMLSMSENDSSLVSQVIDRVSKYTDFMDAPASSRFHLNEPHGLFKHSLGVALRLLSLDAAYGLADSYHDAEIVLAGLLHDLGKAGQTFMRPAEREDPVDECVRMGGALYHVTSFPYYTKRELKTRPGEFEYKRSHAPVKMSVPVSGLHFIGTMLSDIWKPSPDVWQAISYHDGNYVPEGVHIKHSETKLALALHHADIFQSRVELAWVQR